MAPPLQTTFEQLRSICTSDGFDLAQPFRVGSYNAVAPPEDRLHDFGAADRLAVLIGNSRALWPRFEQAVRADAALLSAEHPLERYLESRLSAALARVTPAAFRVYYAHTSEARPLPIQRLAELVGFASLSPSHLSIHAQHGPWIALRAVAVLDLPGPASSPDGPPSPCAACSRPCLPALERALEQSGPVLDSRAIAEHAGAWIAIRDACPLGRGSRYSEPQLRYHYRKDRSCLLPP